MRVIEPHHAMPHRKKAKKHTRRPGVTFSLLLLLVLGSFSMLQLANHYQQTAQQAKQPTAIATASTVQDLQKVASAQDIKFKFFAGDQFQRLYESLQYPNTQSLQQVPTITGNAAADARIITIAESRGYKLRSVPVLPIVQTNEPRLQSDDLLQPKAYSGWQVLKEMAQKENVPLVLNSGYRSIDYQRTLFVSRLQANGGSVAQIAAGQADDAIVRTLLMTAPPGFSRHHTGYTIDLICQDGSVSFEKSSCFTWMSANNYDKTKRAGWVPSYPDGGVTQGPEPEPWEYVWVGLNQVME